MYDVKNFCLAKKLFFFFLIINKFYYLECILVDSFLQKQNKIETMKRIVYEFYKTLMILLIKCFIFYLIFCNSCHIIFIAVYMYTWYDVI